MKNRRGNAVIEVAMWIPFLLLLIGGTVQFGRITYLNYVLQKIVYTAARNLSVQQNLNLCDSADAVIQAVLTNAVTDSSTGQHVAGQVQDQRHADRYHPLCHGRNFGRLQYQRLRRRYRRAAPGLHHRHLDGRLHCPAADSFQARQSDRPAAVNHSALRRE